MTFTRSAHQFKPGRHVWVRPARWIGTREGYLEALHRFAQDEPFKVLRQVSIKGWPHYDLLAPDGATWQVAQLEVSAVPLGMSRDQVVLCAPRRAAAA
jgi:hypothetical protein